MQSTLSSRFPKPVSPRSFALADGNNFYAAAERVFRPEWVGKPLLVLGNNDGNIIARSNAAKALGIPMGAPLHHVRHLINRHGVVVCSANFALYADMSARVMSVLGRFTHALDVYSIDEAFLTLDLLPPDQRAAYAAIIRKTVLQWTGIPMSLGVGPTKTLAKVAAEQAKHAPDGVVTLSSDEEILALLQTLPVSEVWGIGPARAALLARHGIQTAADFAQADTHWVRRHLTVVGQRTQWELRGISCLPLVTAPATKKQVCCSRSFGRDVEALGELEEAVAQYASWAAEKVRAEHCAAGVLVVFLATNPFRRGLRQYQQSATLRLAPPTQDTLEIADDAARALTALHHAVARAGRGALS